MISITEKMERTKSSSMTGPARDHGLEGRWSCGAELAARAAGACASAERGARKDHEQ